MQAVIYERYGPPEVLEVREVETPVPGDRDLLIEVEAASVNRSDWEGLIGKPLYARTEGLRRPGRAIAGPFQHQARTVGGGFETRLERRDRRGKIEDESRGIRTRPDTHVFYGGLRRGMSEHGEQQREPADGEDGCA